METLLGILVFAAFLAAQVGAVIAVQGGWTDHRPHAPAIRGVGVALAAVLLTASVCAQDLSSVAHRFLERHGVPCGSVQKVGSPPDLGEIATCDDGREWALFWLEDEIAFIDPRTREAYRWDREIYLAYPELYSRPPEPDDPYRLLASDRR